MRHQLVGSSSLAGALSRQRNRFLQPQFRPYRTTCRALPKSHRCGALNGLSNSPGKFIDGHFYRTTQRLYLQLRRHASGPRSTSQIYCDQASCFSIGYSCECLLGLAAARRRQASTKWCLGLVRPSTT